MSTTATTNVTVDAANCAARLGSIVACRARRRLGGSEHEQPGWWPHRADGAESFRFPHYDEEQSVSTRNHWRRVFRSFTVPVLMTKTKSQQVGMVRRGAEHTRPNARRQNLNSALTAAAVLCCPISLRTSGNRLSITYSNPQS